MQSTIDIDLHVDHNTSLGGGGGQTTSRFFAVAVHGHASHSLRQFSDTLPLHITDDRICNADIFDRSSRKRLSLTHLRANDPDCSCGDLHLSDLRNFVRLDMRPELDSAAIHGCLPIADVFLKTVQV